MKSVFKIVHNLDVEVESNLHYQSVRKLNTVEHVELPVRDATWGQIAWLLREDLRWGNRRKFDRE